MPETNPTMAQRVAPHGASTPAEQALAKDPDGAARVQEFHRQLFASSSEEVREAAAEVEPPQNRRTGLPIAGRVRGGAGAEGAGVRDRGAL